MQRFQRAGAKFFFERGNSNNLTVELHRDGAFARDVLRPKRGSVEQSIVADFNSVTATRVYHFAGETDGGNRSKIFHRDAATLSGPGGKGRGHRMIAPALHCSEDRPHESGSGGRLHRK